MPESLIQPAVGPDAMWSEELAPSRGQYQALAVLACQLLGVPLNHRLDATVAITRLRLALGQPDAPAPLPDVPTITEF